MKRRRVEKEECGGAPAPAEGELKMKEGVDRRAEGAERQRIKSESQVQKVLHLVCRRGEKNGERMFVCLTRSGETCRMTKAELMEKDIDKLLDFYESKISIVMALRRVE